MPMNKKDLKLSILDIGTKLQGNNVSQTLKDSTERIQLADELGYTRYWFAEHHNTANQVSTSPDLMIAHAATHIKRIRVGSGGIMLPNHSPLKVVENFSLLEALHPGKIDLGIGRAPGTDGLTAYALRRSREAVTTDDFPEQLNEMLSFFKRDFPSNHPFSQIIPVADVLVPELYMLGSSNGGVQFASNEGLGFVFASHLAPHLAIPVLLNYRSNFKASPFMSEPKSIVSVIVITAETEEEANYLAGPVELYWARLYTGDVHSPFPTLEEASKHVYSSNENLARTRNKDRFIIGSIETVAQKLRYLAKETMVDEVMIMEFYSDKTASQKAYRLLAKEFNLVTYKETFK
ncbi:LLM class flavin-dependent oxidoreductase [Bacillus inaquosorum]|uniref:LLM class flavin-dependent oxidoreductase n=1 Tax=Bacillus inaquosorum TaxID=483913 RepID=UPI0022810644|nr:LLM class flavin-dependent oxidoreductase [Bacillus inaquosorum]MCY7821189.1 LLM class flavin-dependent oxidoreductase [Bacillus inaquosorum]MCY7937252.1 LLM class flavin-dependent oxidoreductase [Bacillus inaquosorum]MEC0592407.1 LLM class flavin-dependent oxidoreductase [Bacillus inaquosorum]MEC0680253.1 LLM class flavin-dependent oxidoreductase [Bacillus inaquosorum]